MRKYVAALLLIILPTFTFPAGMTDEEWELVGVWSGSEEETHFHLVLFPTGRYDLEIYGRIAQTGRWSYRFDGSRFRFRLVPGATVPHTVTYQIMWHRGDYMCLTFRSSAPCLELERRSDDGSRPPSP